MLSNTLPGCEAPTLFLKELFKSGPQWQIRLEHSIETKSNEIERIMIEEEEEEEEEERR